LAKWVKAKFSEEAVHDPMPFDELISKITSLRKKLNQECKSLCNSIIQLKEEDFKKLDTKRAKCEEKKDNPTFSCKSTAIFSSYSKEEIYQTTGENEAKIIEQIENFSDTNQYKMISVRSSKKIGDKSLITLAKVLKDNTHCTAFYLSISYFEINRRKQYNGQRNENIGRLFNANKSYFSFFCQYVVFITIIRRE
jgi:hypothetical protein